MLDPNDPRLTQAWEILKAQKDLGLSLEPESNRLAFADPEFLLRRETRGIRFQLELLKPDLEMQARGIEHTIVVFGSARFSSQEQSEQMRLEAQAHGDAQAQAQAEVRLRNARYYEAARQFGARVVRGTNDLSPAERLYVCTGGGPGIMEAANKGAQAGKAPSVGLNILLPFEQQPNSYIDPQLSFEFRYFFMRKFWFVYTAKAIVMFPGGFGTIDEMMELLTLVQTHRITKKMVVVLYGREFWTRVIDFKYLVAQGVISPEDLRLFQLCDSVDEAFAYMTHHLPRNRKKFRLNLEA